MPQCHINNITKDNLFLFKEYASSLAPSGALPESVTL